MGLFKDGMQLISEIAAKDQGVTPPIRTLTSKNVGIEFDSILKGMERISSKQLLYVPEAVSVQVAGELGYLVEMDQLAKYMVGAGISSFTEALTNIRNANPNMDPEADLLIGLDEGAINDTIYKAIQESKRICTECGLPITECSCGKTSKLENADISPSDLVHWDSFEEAYGEEDVDLSVCIMSENGGIFDMNGTWMGMLEDMNDAKVIGKIEIIGEDMMPFYLVNNSGNGLIGKVPYLEGESLEGISSGIIYDHVNEPIGEQCWNAHMSEKYSNSNPTVISENDFYMEYYEDDFDPTNIEETIGMTYNAMGNIYNFLNEDNSPEGALGTKSGVVALTQHLFPKKKYLYNTTGKTVELKPRNEAKIIGNDNKDGSTKGALGNGQQVITQSNLTGKKYLYNNTGETVTLKQVNQESYAIDELEDMKRIIEMCQNEGIGLVLISEVVDSISDKRDFMGNVGANAIAGGTLGGLTTYGSMKLWGNKVKSPVIRAGLTGAALAGGFTAGNYGLRKAKKFLTDDNKKQS